MNQLTTGVHNKKSRNPIGMVCDPFQLPTAVKQQHTHEELLGTNRAAHSCLLQRLLRLPWLDTVHDLTVVTGNRELLSTTEGLASSSCGALVAHDSILDVG